MRRIYYGWIVVAVVVPVLMLSAGHRSAPGAWLLAMRGDLGWSTATLSFAAAVGMLTFGLMGPLAGVAIGRYGVRAVTATGLAGAALAMVGVAQAATPWQLTLLLGVASGVSTGVMGGVLGAVVANRWFVRHRGVVIGATGAAGSAGQLVFYPALALLADAWGWRPTALALGGLTALLLVPVLVWLRDGPERLGLAPLGGVVGPPARPEPMNTLLRRAVVHPSFWLLAATFYVCGATSTGLIGQHFIPHAVSHGFDPAFAASTLAVIGAFNFVGTIASGALTDRFDPRKLLLVYYVFRGLSLLWLPFVHDGVGLIAFAVLFGLDYIATVPPTVALTADAFGRANVGVVYGVVFAGHQLGAAVAAWGAGLVQDATGDYAFALVAAGLMALLAGGMALAIRRSAPLGTVG
jgi:predicted MFS family arabinose efflux permease